MDQSTPVNPSTASALREAIQEIHPGVKLCGTDEKSLLDISDGLLTYIWSILKNESSSAPDASLDDWSELLAVLKAHWIIPLLYWYVGSLSREYLPPESVINEMRNKFLLSRIHSFHMERQLGEIIEAFQREGVRALVLRGPALAWSLYPDPAMRPSGDLDLLVIPEQVAQARGILEGLGYKCLARRFEFAKDFFREECFVHQKNPRDNLMVDLHWVHWELHPFFESNGDVEIEDLFHRAWKVESSALVFETLHPVDYLIHSAIHLMMIHNLEMRLSWIYDTALIAQHLRVPDDWETLQERSVAWRARLPVEHCLRMAQLWTGLQLPEAFKDFSTWPQPTEDEQAIWSDTMRHHYVTVLLKRSLSNPSMLLKRVPSLFHLLFPHPDIVRFCYPTSRKWLLPLSYVRRWFRWIDDLVVNRIGH